MQIKQCAELGEFNRLNKEIENLYYTMSVKAGVSDSAFWIMYAIVELGDGCLQKDIAKRYSFSPQTVSSSVRSLVKKGYITLKHGKGRNMHLILTPAGTEFVLERIVPLMEIENRTFQIMSTEDSRELLRLSRKCNEIFKEQIRKLLWHQEESIVSSADGGSSGHSSVER